MKKRILAGLTAVVLCIPLFAGCSQKAETEAPAAENNTAEKEAEEPAAEPELTHVTLNEVAHSIFYAPMYVAIEEGYFEEEGIDLELVCGFGADKTMTAVISGEADIGFMGSEASIYTYAEGATDYVVNFAQLTQRAGNFLVAREEMPDFKWEDLKGSVVLGGRKGGMPEMVFEYILKVKENGIDPETDLEINQNIDFGSTAAAFAEGQGEFTVEFEPGATTLESEGKGLCRRLSRRGQRIRALHGIQRKEKLYRRKSRHYPGIHQCAPERHGLCPGSYPRGNRGGHRAPVPGNRSGNDHNDRNTLLRSGHMEEQSDLRAEQLRSSSGYPRERRRTGRTGSV